MLRSWLQSGPKQARTQKIAISFPLNFNNVVRCASCHVLDTAELNGENAFDYLVALLRHPAQIAANPAEWMPWNFRMTLQRISAGPDPPA